MSEQVQLMIDWIEERLTEEISLNDMSHDVGYSPYYCSFKFHQAAGISIRRYILLRRLYLSSVSLLDGDRILDTAVEYGYSSQESYSRAFKSVFGISPGQFQLKKQPVQSYVRLSINDAGRGIKVDISRKLEVRQLQNKNKKLFDQDVLNVLNGQHMYEEFKQNALMGDSDYVPFNEAMSVNEAAEPIFGEHFINVRSSGHNETVENYMRKVIHPLSPLFDKTYQYIVLWFGEDMFCQMNLLTILAYLEQSGYSGRVYLNTFREDAFKVNQTEIILGNYSEVYQSVLIRHEIPSGNVFPLMFQAVKIYLDMLHDDNEVMKYISEHQHLPEKELVPRLFNLFPEIGYGDTQYIHLINKMK